MILYMNDLIDIKAVIILVANFYNKVKTRLE